MYYATSPLQNSFGTVTPPKYPAARINDNNSHIAIELCVLS